MILSMKLFLESSIGENTLVVGHSNTIPGFVNNLIEKIIMIKLMT